MSQTSVIFFYILAGFAIYITAKGELPQYLNLALGKSGSGGSAATKTASTDNTGQYLQYAAIAASVL